MTPEIIDEVQFTRSENFHLGEFIYMGMGKVKEQTVCLAVAYKIDYCIKKALQLEKSRDCFVPRNDNLIKGMSNS